MRNVSAIVEVPLASLNILYLFCEDPNQKSLDWQTSWICIHKNERRYGRVQCGGLRLSHAPGRPGRHAARQAVGPQDAGASSRLFFMLF